MKNLFKHGKTAGAPIIMGENLMIIVIMLFVTFFIIIHSMIFLDFSFNEKIDDLIFINARQGKGSPGEAATSPPYMLQMEKSREGFSGEAPDAEDSALKAFLVEGLSVEGLSVEGLSVEGLSVKGLSVEGSSVKGSSFTMLHKEGAHDIGTDDSHGHVGYPGLLHVNHILSGLLNQYQIERILDFYGVLARDRDIARLILKESLENHVPVNLAFALAWRESGFNPRAVNKNRNGSVDRGIFQLNDSYRQEWSEDSFYDAAKNVKEGVLHLKQCLEDTGWDIARALGAYNAGLNASLKGRLSVSTLKYIDDILKKEARLDDDLFEIMGI
ncbi:MAG: transglycosylase SLT domain-containing protein [Desulfamplus sp.]|nr:transglycosylase SLT domain-containing protein [Desulfamplus sp.]